MEVLQNGSLRLRKTKFFNRAELEEINDVLLREKTARRNLNTSRHGHRLRGPKLEGFFPPPNRNTKLGIYKAFNHR